MIEPPMLFFVVFYGLDRVATVPPTLALCRERFGADAPIVFGWVPAAHQVGAGFIAVAGGVARDRFGGYDLAWHAAGLLCAVAAVMSLLVRAEKTGLGAARGNGHAAECGASRR